MQQGDTKGWSRGEGHAGSVLYLCTAEDLIAPRETSALDAALKLIAVCKARGGVKALLVSL